MRKKTFLKAVCIFTCLSILMLSVPGASARPRIDKRTEARDTFMKRAAYMFFSFLPVLHLNTTSNTSSDTVSNNDSNKKIKITGGLLRAMLGDED